VEDARYFNGGEFSVDRQTWAWSTGESTNFSPWNEPPNPDYPCGSMKTNPGDYVSASDCAGSLGAICEFGAY
jgi:hypothetical protein